LNKVKWVINDERFEGFCSSGSAVTSNKHLTNSFRKCINTQGGDGVLMTDDNVADNVVDV